MKLSNESCKEQAIKAAENDNHEQAMKWYNSAAARTIGHSKSARYEMLAEKEAVKACIKYDHLCFAKDSESVE